MIRDRASMFFGGLLALLSAMVLVFAGSRLLAVIGALAQADRGLGNDLNIARPAPKTCRRYRKALGSRLHHGICNGPVRLEIFQSGRETAVFRSGLSDRFCFRGGLCLDGHARLPTFRWTYSPS